ncbi:MAG: transporter substrate-binding domain-containing protein [Actinomycetota bacterium]|nr:transporter substrate-binding domain-containing protein [Actinomycetota bacterium]MDA8399627.1 transporter substrate-binding domain-containing protein [Actinomycetota bacterium]
MVTVISDVNFPPFEFMKGSKRVGFDFGLLSALAKTENFKPSVSLSDFNGIIPSLQAGRSEMSIASITVLPARAKVVDFTLPYFRSGLSLAVRRSNSTITGPTDLIGKTVAVSLGTSSQLYLQHLPFASKIHIETYSSSALAYLAVEQHRAAATISDAAVLRYDNNKAGAGGLKLAGPLLTHSLAAIAVAKHHRALLNALNAGLLKLARNGTYARLYAEWFGRAPSRVPGQFGGPG